jgi:hypothetical protein
MDKTMPPIQSPVGYGDQDENGVDLSLIRDLLKLTPRQRVLRMSDACRNAYRLYQYGRRNREARLSQSQ